MLLVQAAHKEIQMTSKKRTILVYSVELECPPGATLPQVKEYILTAVKGWKGGLHPDDPMFSLNADTIGVKLAQRLTSYR